MNLFHQKITEYLTKRIYAGTYRRLPKKSRNNLVDFTSNDYLALSNEPILIQAAYDYAKAYGTGAKASRLLAYNTEVHVELENTIARDKGTETALVFVSGYQANACALATLLSATSSPLVFSDRLNHASIHHACTLAEVRQIRYTHLDMDDLEKRIQQHQQYTGVPFIVTESVFGMDGDCVDMAQLAHIATKYDATLYIDEAHATGVVGDNGFGLACRTKPQHTSIILGTFSKALGGSGGYIACSKLVKRYLLNACGGQIYSTALSPVMAGVALAAWRMIPSLAQKRAQLHENAKLLARTLRSAGLDASYLGSAIVPIVLGDTNMVLRLQTMLAHAGYAVAAIRHPTVPKGTERLRMSCNAEHTQEDILAFAHTLVQCWQKLQSKVVEG